MDMGELTEKFKDFEKSKKYTKMQDTVWAIQKEIKKNKNHGQTEMIKLDELLKKIFDSLNIDDLDSINEQLKEILDKIRAINKENERLAARYDGNYAFVKTYQDLCEMHPEYDKKNLEGVLDIVYSSVKDIKDNNILILQGRDIFTTSVKKSTTKELLKSGLYKKLTLKDWYTDILNEVYMNLKKF